MEKKEKQADKELASLWMVLGYIAIKDFETLEDRVPVLVRLGYGNKEIARICGTTPLTVAVTKSSLKKKKRGVKQGGRSK